MLDNEIEEMSRREFLRRAGMCVGGGALAIAAIKPSLAETIISEDKVQTDEIDAPTGRCATFTVAANNSSTLSKQQADYVCDGTADDVQIQAAIDALPAVGGTVQLMEGRFYLSTQITTVEYLHLCGQGNGSVIDTTATMSVMIEITNDNVEISNIMINPTNVSYYSTHAIDSSQSVLQSNISIHNCTFLGTVISGNPWPDNNTDSTIRKCIETGRAYNWRIENNHFERCSYEGVSISADCVGTVYYPEQIIVIGNTFNTIGYGGIVVEGKAKYCTFAGNIIHSRSNHSPIETFGISIQHSGTTHCIITDNIINAQNCGISLSNSITYCDITNNHLLSESGGTGIKVGGTNNNILNNSCIGVFSNGIDASTLTGNNNNICGNTAVACTNGIIIDQPHTFCSGNIVKNAKTYLIRLLSNADYCKITNNELDAALGITLLHIASSFCDIQMNTFSDSATESNSTFDGDIIAGETVITVVNALEFSVGEYITTTPSGFGAENNRISSIDYGTNEITLTTALANNHTNGDAIAGRIVSSRCIWDNNNNYITNNQFSSNIPTAIGNIGANSTIYKQKIDLLMDALAVSTTYVRSNEDLSAATPITFTLDAQPDIPRTLSWSFDTHAQITEYDMEVIGIDAKGNTVTETWDETAGWSGETNNAFATITSIKMTSRTGTGAADTMDIGITDVLGLSNVIYETSDVFKIKKNNANATVATAQVNTTYDTYDMSEITLGAGDDFTIWYKSNLNIIS